jgi:hypothetical protein
LALLALVVGARRSRLIALTAMVATALAVVVTLTRRPVVSAAVVVTGLLVLPAAAAGLVRAGRRARAQRDGDQDRDGEEGERTPIEAMGQQRDHESGG